MAIVKPIILPRWGETVGGVLGPTDALPASGKMDIGWTPGEEPPAPYENWLKRLTYEWLLYLSSSLQTGAIEGFESTTFPPAEPTGAWTSPSPRIGTLGWVRDTVTPITQNASASRPTGQPASTVSSLGLSCYLQCPSRMVFDYVVKCNPASADFIAIYIDGGAYTMTSNAGPTTESGRFYSPVLREGLHTFDWVFVRSGLTSVSGERCSIDSVQIIPESLWGIGDFSHQGLIEEFLTAGTVPPGWTQRSGANAGSLINSSAVLSVNGSIRPANPGVLGIRTAAVAATDWTSIQNDPIQGFGASGFAGTMFQALGRWYIEFDFWVPSVTNVSFNVGLVGHADVVGVGTERYDVIYDSALGTTYRFRVVTAGVATLIDSGVVAVPNQLMRVRLSNGGVANFNLGVCAFIGAPPNINSINTGLNRTAGFAFSPVAHIESRVSPAVNVLNIDTVRSYVFANFVGA